MYRLLILILFLTACQELPLVPSTQPEEIRGLDRPYVDNNGTINKRVALVIGNANYKFGPLKNPVNDAREMAKALRSVGFDVIKKENASWEAMDQAITAFKKKLGKGVVGLFYFSGHGIQIDDKNYLIPVDLPELAQRHVKFRSIFAGDVLSAMQSTNNSMNIVILDACRNNPFKSLNKGMKKGLARAENIPTGTLIAYATSPGDTAADGDGKNSPYTAGLLAHIYEPNLAIELMFKRVRNTVVQKTGNSQTPWESSSLKGDDFYFVSSASDTPPVVVPPKPTTPPVVVVPLKPSTVFRDPLHVGGFGPEMVIIPAGSFRMGDIQGGGDFDEKPVHRVSVSAFSMGKYEVTVGDFRQFVKVTGYKTDAEKYGSCWVYRGNRSGKNWRNPSFSQSDNQPVVCVSLNDATAYIKWLSQQTDKNYRLPTEAEWEYAARAGTSTKRYWGNQADKACAYANVADKTAQKTFSGWAIHNCTDGYTYTAPVGQFKPNAFGLFDMLGNVWEWVHDIYDSSYYRSSPRSNPRGPSGKTGQDRVGRGGAWGYIARNARAANRAHYKPDGRVSLLGFRLVRQP